MSDDDVVVALRVESEALVGVLRGLDAASFGLVTNCPPWDLAELVVHMGDSVNLRRAFGDAELGMRVGSAADYYRRPERGTSEYRQRNVDESQERAREVLVDSSAVDWFEGVVGNALGVLEGDDLDRVVLASGRGAMRLGDWVVTRVISLAAHGLDVAITLGRESWTTEAALKAVRPVFVELLGGEPPVSLGWDDGEFLAVATGRRGLTESERVLLGSSHERFPLLS
jgi:uncharacterized protein (TIGR03083 family)